MKGAIFAILICSGNILVKGVSIADSVIPHEELDKEVAHAEKHKFDEVNNLMSKYDKAEARAEYLASPEYAEKQERKKEAEEMRKK